MAAANSSYLQYGEHSMNHQKGAYDDSQNCWPSVCSNAWANAAFQAECKKKRSEGMFGGLGQTGVTHLGASPRGQRVDVLDAHGWCVVVGWKAWKAT